jgi:hypothetical protein
MLIAKIFKSGIDYGLKETTAIWGMLEKHVGKVFSRSNLIL